MDVEGYRQIFRELHIYTEDAEPEANLDHVLRYDGKSLKLYFRNNEQ